MPTYEYSCQKCGASFECVQSMKDPAYTVCPKELCPQKKWGKGAVKRGVGGGTGLIFKGSGFYITDYRSEGYKSAAKKDAGSGSSSSDSTPASTPATPAAPSSPAAPAPAKPAAPAKSSGGNK